MSILVPVRKVSTMLAEPEASLEADMYFSPSSPFIFCSMICVTLSSMVFAEAPG